MTAHLLHVGYPKAGSKFLQRWFDEHPQLAHHYAAIGGFRDAHEIAREGCTRRDVRYRVTSNEELTAPRPEAGGLLFDYERPRELGMAESQERVCSILSSFFPGATVLIVTRGFRSMIYSSLSQYARSGGDADLATMMREKSSEESLQVAMWDYDFLVGLYQRTFGEASVIVMPYELLRDDAVAFTRALSDRLGIDPLPPSPERVNESLSAVEMYWYPRITRVVRRIGSRRMVERYAVAALRNDLRTPIAWLDRMKPGRPFTAASIPDELVDAFRGRAESLRSNPLFAPYAADYLFD